MECVCVCEWKMVKWSFNISNIENGKQKNNEVAIIILIANEKSEIKLFFHHHQQTLKKKLYISKTDSKIRYLIDLFVESKHLNFIYPFWWWLNWIDVIHSSNFCNYYRYDEWQLRRRRRQRRQWTERFFSLLLFFSINKIQC